MNTLILIFLISMQTLKLFAAEIVLENKNLKAVFNDTNGSLEQLINKRTGWKIQKRPELAQSFQLQVPLPDQRFNPVYGQIQKLSDIRHENDQVVFTWKNLKSEKGGMLNIEFKGTARMTEDGLVFTAEIKNNSSNVIETVSWPYLGDLTVPTGANQLYQLGMRYGGLKKLELYPKFANQPGYFSVDYPMQTMSTPYTLFSLIDDGTQGLYVGYLDTTAEHMVKFTARLLPGYVSYELWDTGINPKTDEISGQAVHLEFSTSHFPFINPGEKINLHPVILQPYQGSWHKGVDYYKKWRATWFKAAPKPDWLKEVHAWQQIHVNNPEDDIRYSYNDLVEIGKDCVRHNVKAIQVTGWTIGGQDEGNPSHDIDPRLGTYEDLEKAISEVQAMGVKMVLFTKFTWADRTKDWYLDELINYTVKDPYGEPWYHSGYAYQTPVQLAGINTHRFSPMCHLSARWREIANKEFVKPLKLNADGILFDENQHHGGAHYCFDTSHGHHVPAHIFAGDAYLADGFHKISKKMNSGYVYAGEGHYDLEYRHYHVSYFRVDLNHVPIHRYVAPEEEMMIAVAGYNDRNMINLALMNRYIFSYEPRNFKGRLDEFPLTIEYGKKVDALRKRYQDYFWKGLFRHTLGAEVLANGKSFDSYSVFVNRTNGKRAVIVVNYDYDHSIDVRVELEGKVGDLWTVTPEDPDPKKYVGNMIVPENSAVVLIEK